VASQEYQLIHKNLTPVSCELSPLAPGPAYPSSPFGRHNALIVSLVASPPTLVALNALNVISSRLLCWLLVIVLPMLV